MMRMLCGLTLLTSLLALAAAAEGREILELTNGYTIEGDVIKETPGEVIVDVGVEILRIPTDRIARRRDPAAEAGPMGSENGSTQIDEGFFRTARLPRSNVRDLAATYGEAVVLVRTPGGLGSGFILNDDGYCVTNHHVIKGETRISVTIFRKRDDAFEKLEIDDVKIAALNPFFDLALLKIPRPDDYKFEITLLAREDEINVGDPVFAIGNPLGLERSVSQGIISTNNRNLEGLLYLQTTAQINPGNSGGPLFNLRGEVVGVTSMKVGGAEGLGFAIPIEYVKHFLEHRDAFAYDRNNPNNGYRYLNPPRRRTARQPESATSNDPTEGPAAATRVPTTP